MKRLLLLAVVAAVIAASQSITLAAEYATTNFVAIHPSAEFARQVAETAEQSRDDVALLWLKQTLPPWSRKCPIQVNETGGNGGGATSFSFDQGEVFGWNMRVEGSRTAIINDVVPHEVTHTVMASHFRHHLPRWADEGMATMSESAKGHRQQYAALKQTWVKRPLPFHQLLEMKEYPADSDGVLSLYARGFFLTKYLVEKHGRSTFLKFIENGQALGWHRAIAGHYGYSLNSSVEMLERDWRGWVQTDAALKPVSIEVAQQFSRKPHVLFFGFEGCQPCVPVHRDIDNGSLDALDIEYVDVMTEEGNARFIALGAAIEKANPNFQFRREVPAFHRAGDAYMLYGYNNARQQAGARLLKWGLETVRLPLTLSEDLLRLIYPNRGTGRTETPPEPVAEQDSPTAEPVPTAKVTAAPATPAETKPDTAEPSIEPAEDPADDDGPLILKLLAAGLALIEVFAGGKKT